MCAILFALKPNETSEAEATEGEGDSGEAQEIECRRCKEMKVSESLRQKDRVLKYLTFKIPFFGVVIF